VTDLIVDEVRRARDEYAARFNYDLDAIFRDVKDQERLSGRKFVSFVEADTHQAATPNAAMEKQDVESPEIASSTRG
jgi:hypothetical protein